MADLKADTATSELSRRVDPRYPAAAVPAITSMRLSPGETVSLVNISASGVLVEGKTRFVPGTRVTVHLEGTIKPNQIKARVVRCQVSAIGAGGSLHYQSAITFEGRLELPVDEAVAPPPTLPPVEEPAPAPKKGKAAPAPAPTRAYNRW